MRFTRDLRPVDGSCFVVMPFGTKALEDGREFDWDEHYRRVIEPAVRDAGMTPTRADDIYGVGGLLEDVWTGIQRAEVMLADLTGRNANVMYELGLGHVIGKRIVMLAMGEADLPADLRQYKYIGYSPDDPHSLLDLTRNLTRSLSAARADLANEQTLIPMPGGGVEPVTATVVTVNRDCVIVRAANGRRGLLDPEDVSWSKRRMDMTARFKPGDILQGAFVSDVKGEPRYSLIALKDDPWPKLAAEFPVGHRFIGRVSGQAPVGLFVPLSHDISGLVRQSQLPPGTTVARGAELDVAVKRLDPDERQVELTLVRIVSEPAAAGSGRGTYVGPDRFVGEVHSVQLARSFVLVTLPHGGLGLLHSKRMGAELEARFRSGALAAGDQVDVVVEEVDATRDRVALRDAATTEPAAPSEAA